MRIFYIILLLSLLQTMLFSKELPEIDKEILLKELNRIVNYDLKQDGYGKDSTTEEFEIKKITGFEWENDYVIKINIDEESLNRYIELRKMLGDRLFVRLYFAFSTPDYDFSNIKMEDIKFYFSNSELNHPRYWRPLPVYIAEVENDVALALHATLKEIERQENRFFSFRKKINFGNLLFEDRGDYLIVSSESTGEKNDNWRCHVRKHPIEVIKCHFPHKKPQVIGEITRLDEEIVMIIQATLTAYDKHFGIWEDHNKWKPLFSVVYIGDLVVEDKDDHYRVFTKAIEGIIGGGFNCYIQKGTYEVIKFVPGK